jgi:anaerobic selenocysteine-containing dehydrogenase
MPPQIAHSACPLDCPDACSLDIRVEDGRVVKLDGDRRNPFTQGTICAKVRRLPEHLYGADRLLYPARRVGAKGEGRFERLSWDDALDLLAVRFRAVRDRLGGEAILPYSYGGSNGLLTQDTTDALLFRRLGASRLARTVCAAPSGAAAIGLYGKMVGVALEDAVHAKLIVIWGTNPAASGIHWIPIVQEAQRRGAKLVVVDPLRTQTAKRADLHLAARPGTDVVLALAAIRWLFENGRADLDFLATHATGVEELRQRALPWTIERAAATCGLAQSELETFFALYAGSSPAMIRCGWGLERNRNGGSAVAAVLALPAVAGKFGVRGGGYTMSQSGAWKFGAIAEEPEPPTRLVNMNRLGRALTEFDDPPVGLLFVYNSNALATSPDQERIRRGLLRENLFTVVFDQVLTDTARHADLVLPATAFPEHHELRRGYGTLVLQSSPPVATAAGEARPNYEVFAELLRRLDLLRAGDRLEPAAMLRAAVTDSEAVTRLEAGEILNPACGPAPVQFVDVFPNTADGKIHLVPPALDREAPGGLYAFRPNPQEAQGTLTLLSPATHRTISSSLGQLDDTRAAVEMSRQDARARNIAAGDSVRVYNELGEVRCAARLSDDVPVGVAMLPKGLWAKHTDNGATANALAPDSLTDLGGGACFNDARVEIERLESRSS